MMTSTELKVLADLTSTVNDCGMCFTNMGDSDEFRFLDEDEQHTEAQTVGAMLDWLLTELLAAKEVIKKAQAMS